MPTPTVNPNPELVVIGAVLKEITVRIPDAELQPLDKVAKAKCISRSYAVREAVKAWLQKEEKATR